MSSIRPAGGIAVTLPLFPDAACKGTDPHLWFAPEVETPQARQWREAEARRICSGCPSRVPCLEFALSQPDLHGVWGGLTEDERQHGPRLCRNKIHLMDAANTWTDGNGHEKCRACRAAGQRRYEAARRAS